MSFTDVISSESAIFSPELSSSGRPSMDISPYRLVHSLEVRFPDAMVVYFSDTMKLAQIEILHHLASNQGKFLYVILSQSLHPRIGQNAKEMLPEGSIHERLWKLLYTVRKNMDAIHI